MKKFWWLVFLAMLEVAGCTYTSPTAPTSYAYGACSASADSVQQVKGTPPVIILYDRDDDRATWQYPDSIPAWHILVDYRWHHATCAVKEYEMR